MKTLSSADHRNISAWAIRNPVATTVLFLLLTVGGLFAFPSLRINNTPDIDLPAVVVTVAQPGAAPSELETQVTRRVEDAVAGLGEVKHMTSTVVDGASTTVVEFELGKDVDRATNDVRNKVAQIRSDLPAGIREPVITRVEATGGAILTYTIAAPRFTDEQLSWFVDDTVSKAPPTRFTCATPDTESSAFDTVSSTNQESCSSVKRGAAIV